MFVYITFNCVVRQVQWSAHKTCTLCIIIALPLLLFVVIMASIFFTDQSSVKYNVSVINS